MFDQRTEPDAPNAPGHNPGGALIPYLNRLSKRLKHFRKWAARRNLGAYRTYDRDMPEFPFTVDIYGQTAVISILKRLNEEEEADDGFDLEELRRQTAAVLGLAEGDVYLKLRQRQKGTKQYTPLADDGHEMLVNEGPLRFLVNPGDYLDTGLFLDHRPWRERLLREAKNLKVLNLFCYTGSLSVAAAKGGAELVTSVDLSSTYLAWAERNLRANGLFSEKTPLIRADVLRLLSTRGRERYDLILLDPPSFSNSKAMRDTLDIQRDQTGILRQAASHLAQNGVIWFSTNRRGFRLERDCEELFVIRETTSSSVPEDFPYSRPHKSYELRRR